MKLTKTITMLITTIAMLLGLYAHASANNFPFEELPPEVQCRIADELEPAIHNNLAATSRTINHNLTVGSKYSYPKRTYARILWQMIDDACGPEHKDVADRIIEEFFPTVGSFSEFARNYSKQIKYCMQKRPYVFVSKSNGRFRYRIKLDKDFFATEGIGDVSNNSLAKILWRVIEKGIDIQIEMKEKCDRDDWHMQSLLYSNSDGFIDGIFYLPEQLATSPVRQIEFEMSFFSDLSPLAEMSQLKRLNLLSTNISDLSPLAKMTQLVILNLCDTSVSDLMPLAGLTELVHLNLNNTLVSDLTPLAGLAQMTRLRLSATSVTDLSPLTGMSQLRHLDISHTEISDVAALLGLSDLRVIIVSNSDMAGLTQLQAALPNLEIIVRDAPENSN